MDTQNINVVGVTDHTDGDSTKYTAFIFDFPQSNYCGEIYQIGKSWRVLPYGDDMTAMDKEATRRAVVNLNPQDFSYIDNPEKFLQERGKHLKVASDSQIEFIKFLFNTVPQGLHAQTASEIINYMRFYNTVVLNTENMVAGCEGKRQAVIDKMNAFIAKEHTYTNSLDFVDEFHSIIKPCYDFYQQNTSIHTPH